VEGGVKETVTLDAASVLASIREASIKAAPGDDKVAASIDGGGGSADSGIVGADVSEAAPVPSALAAAIG
jgi:hypothetical protein